MFCSASLQVLIDRNWLWNIHGFLQMIQGFISLIDLRFSNCTPYFRATLSAASLDWFWIQSSAPLNLLIHQDGVSASSDWILIQDGDVSALWILEVFSQEKHPSTDWSFHLLAFNRISVATSRSSWSVSWYISCLRSPFLGYFTPPWNTFLVISKHIPAVLSSLLSSQSSYQSVQSIPDKPSSDHLAYPISKFLVPLF